MNFTIGRYIPNDTWFHHLDPRFKVMALLFLLVAIFFPAGYPGYGLMFVAIFIALKVSQLSFKNVLNALKPLLFMFIFLTIVNMFYLHGGILLVSIGPIKIYSEAISSTFYIVVRLTLMIMVTTILTSTTKPLDLTLAIEDLLAPFQKIGVPSHVIAMLISIALRFIPDLVDETNRIMKAQESRGVDIANGKFKEKLMAILALVIPLIISAFQRAEDLANAMEARGYSPNKPRTRYRQLKATHNDYLFIGLILIIVVVLAIMAFVL